MDNIFNSSKWIWYNGDIQKNSYAEFFSEFNYGGGKVEIAISADSDFVLYINGKRVLNNQYGDFERYKVYSKKDITPYLNKGKNTFAALVWYFGEDSMRYFVYKPGLIFKIFTEKEVLLESNTNILSRKSLAYQSGFKQTITFQLGFSFNYNANLETDWKNCGGQDFAPSIIIDKNCNFYLKPINELSELEYIDGKVSFPNDNKLLTVDLGKEAVGLIDFSFISDCEQKLTIIWAERLKDDGNCPRKIGSRDFSVHYTAKVGLNNYANYMLRLGVRYIQFEFEKPVTKFKVGLICQNYYAKKREIIAANPLDKNIYDLCVRTLNLCMMEHYVDCPWREQCLYAFDSRNQMLFGYYAFENGNADYARANLLLMSKDYREDGLMSICYPCGHDLTIPSFSLHFIIALKEYVDFTGDISLFLECKSKVDELLNTFINNLSNGLIDRFEGANHWNFYDWSRFSEGTLNTSQTAKPEFMLNALFILALSAVQSLSKIAGLPFEYDGLKEDLIKNLRQRFYLSERKLYTMEEGEDMCAELVNVFAILSGVATKEQQEDICKAIVEEKMPSCSLSMTLYKYKALMLCGKDKYKNWIIDKVRGVYKKMLDAGATSVWEVEDCIATFGDAGSMCHAWACVPVYLFHELGLVNYR